MSPFDHDAISQELDRVTASRHFAHSPNLQRFLRFAVEQQLKGRADEIKESLIAIEVFHRRSTFDSRLDSIVRVQATALRKKLAAYYASEGAAAPIRIHLDRGRYVASFQHAQAPESVPPPPLSPANSRYRSKQLALCAACASLFFLFVAFKPKDTPGSALWASYFKPGARTIIVYGTPQFFGVGGLLLRDVNVNSASGIQPGSPILAWRKAARDAPISTDSTLIYTGIGEAFGVQEISRYFWEKSRQPELLLNNEFSSQSSGNANLIIVASLRFQTFLNEFHFPSDFIRVNFSGGDGEAIRNTRPAPSEQPVYSTSRHAKSSQAVEYALVSLLPWRNGAHRVLVLGGTSTYATEAAAEFVTDPVALQHLDWQLRAFGSPAYFQCLLRVYVNGTHVTHVEYVTHHALHPIPSTGLVAALKP